MYHHWHNPKEIAFLVLLVANVQIISTLPLSSGRELAIRPVKSTTITIWDMLQPHFRNFINTVFADDNIFENFEQYLKGLLDVVETSTSEINQIAPQSNGTVVFEKRPARWGSQFSYALKGVLDVLETSKINQIEPQSNGTVVFEKRPGSRWGSEFSYASNGFTGFLKGAAQALMQSAIQNKDTSIMIPSSQISFSNIATGLKSWIDYESTDHTEKPKKKKKKKKKKTQEVISANE